MRVVATVLMGSLFVASPLSAQSSTTSFSIAERGGATKTTTGAGEFVGVGSASIQASGAVPEGLAVFGLWQNNTLVSEVSVPAANLVNAGRIFAEIGGGINTGLALVNAMGSPTDIAFYFTDLSGTQRASGVLTVPANGQVSRFLTEAPFNSGPSFLGTFTFFTLRDDPTLTIGAVALRSEFNLRGDFLMTALPVAPVGSRGLFSGNTIPHFASGGGWSSEIILVNPGDAELAGSLSFINPAGALAAVESETGTGASFSYRVAPRSSFRLRTLNNGAPLSGSVKVTPLLPNDPEPVAFVFFSFKQGAVKVATSAVAPTRPSLATRVFVENVGQFDQGQAGSLGTGIAISNADALSTTAVTLELTTLSGTTTGLSGNLTIPAGGQISTFLNQVPGFESLPAAFKGVLRISAAQPVSVTALRIRYNERRELLTSMAPTVNEADPYFEAALRYSDFVFPMFADGGGYATQFVFLSGWTPGPSTGTLEFRTAVGSSYPVTFR